MQRGVCILFLLCGLALAQPRDIFPLEALEQGLSGYALTAGANNVIERFPIEVLALQYDIGLGFPVVLVQASGDFIEQSGGIAAGMSGSPVFIPLPSGDKLLGAIGFIFPQSDHSLALVTPIEVMMRTVPERPLDSLLGEQPAAPLNFGQDLDELGAIQAVRTPLLFAGLSGRASNLLKPLFAQGFTSPLPMQSKAALSSQDADFVLTAGSPISVQLARGDVTIAAIGTVTALDGDKIWGFGHPFFGHGAVSFALAPAYVNHIVPSDVVPFKLADSGQRNLGTITQDRPYAVSGIVELEPNFLPINLTFNGAAGSRTSSFEISNDERYYSTILAAASLQAFDELNQEIRAGTSDIGWEIKLSGGETLNLLEQVYHPSDIAAATANLIAEPLLVLAENIYKRANIEAVNIVVTVDQEQRFADIARVVVDQETINQGDDLTAFVRLQPYRQGPEVKTVRVPLPAELSGEVEIIFRGGLEPSEEEEEEDRPIFTFEELLVALRENVQASELVVETLIEGESERLLRLPLPYLIEGSKTVTITIETPESEEEGMPDSEETRDPVESGN